MSRAGHSIRVMAWRRRIRAIALAGAGFLSLGIPMALPWLLRQWFPTLSIPISPWFYILGGIFGVIFLVQAGYYWQRANHADQGAAGEEAIAQLLSPLEREGWILEYGIRHRAVGDIDIFLRSPNGRLYTIDVKSHRGTVGTDGKHLYRRYGRSKYPFEKDFLSQAKRQAIAIKKLKRLEFVTPMVVFSQADVNITQNPVVGVYVLSAQTLLKALRSLG